MSLASRGLAVVILAAGRGTRMRSELPKALQPMCGTPMLGHVLATAGRAAKGPAVVVAGFGIGQVRKFVGKRAAVVEQRALLGSGHAVAQAERALKNFKGPVAVLYCDTPLVDERCVELLVRERLAKGADAAILTTDLESPTGYGRVVRSREGWLERLVEETDASNDEKAIREINVGCYVFGSAPQLFAALKRVPRNPVKNEYYLTDAVSILAREARVCAVKTRDHRACLGVNTQADLARVGEVLQARIIDRLAEQGVRFRAPSTSAIDADVRIGAGTCIHAGCVIEEGSVIGKDCRIGPYARIRGGSVIEDGAVIGNFVEVVRSKVGRGSQVKHLSYLGDARVGRGVNVGAGTITANYDGTHKHLTRVGDGARLGSGTVLVAPVSVGKAAMTGAGAVVTRGRNVAPGRLVVGVPARAVPNLIKRKGRRNER